MNVARGGARGACSSTLSSVNAAEQMLRLGFLASHNGSNMQAIVDACREGRLSAAPVLVISNNSQSGALRRAETEGIAARHISAVTHPGSGEEDAAVVGALQAHDVDLVVLAGYMKRLGPVTLSTFAGRILNIHPSLLPKFGGQGMYGRHVHEAVIEAGERESGVTIHLVDGEYDTGPVIEQRAVPVMPGDDAASLAARVLEEEHRFFAATLQKIATGEIALPALGTRLAR